jgi:cytochrome c
MSKSLNLFGGTATGLVVMLVGAYNFADRNVSDMPETARSLAPLTAIQRAALEDAQATGAEQAQAEPASAGGLIAAAHADEAAGAGLQYGLGRKALPEEVAAWDVDVRPDATGLPEGSGSVSDGETLFSQNCAVCHGEFAEGVGNWPALSGGEGTLADEDPVKTVGSYWPYLSTAWDYVHRSMPYGNAQSLTADETYAIVAYILYSSWLVEDDFVLSDENFLEVEMPNADGFIIDDRAETEYADWRAEPCMENCKEAAPQVTMRATVLDVTPEETAAEEEAAAEPAAEETTEMAAASTGQEPAVTMAAADPAMVEQGERVFRKCSACHQVGDGAKNRVGPHLNGVMGREIGIVDGFNYSSTMAGMGGVWDTQTMAAFLADPRGVVSGTKMAFAGLRKDDEIAAVTAYLSTFEE